jgi:hypothetical protein
MAAPDASSPFASWKVDHAGIRVPDFEEAVACYCVLYWTRDMDGLFLL